MTHYSNEVSHSHFFNFSFLKSFFLNIRSETWQMNFKNIKIYEWGSTVLRSENNNEINLKTQEQFVKKTSSGFVRYILVFRRDPRTKTGWSRTERSGTRTRKSLKISDRFGPVDTRTRRSVDPWSFDQNLRQNGPSHICFETEIWES